MIYRNNASALTFLDPGIWEMVKLNRVKKSAYMDSASWHFSGILDSYSQLILKIGAVYLQASDATPPKLALWLVAHG